MTSEQISKAVETIRNGGVVVYPTDTAYGLAVDATNPIAVKRLYEVKGRNFNKPVHVIFPSFVELNRVVKLNAPAKKIIQKLFPGPITIVLPLKKNSGTWKQLSSGSGTLGFRMPDHKVVKHIVKTLGRPITATSANRSGRVTCYTVKAIRAQFKKSKLKPDYYLNGGKLKQVKPSTIVAINDHKVAVLREGPISIETIRTALK